MNGKLSPYAEVKAAPYRLRILNACNARFINLATDNGQEFIQIGSDQGLLAKPERQKHIEPGAWGTHGCDRGFQRGGSGARIALNNDLQAVMQFRIAESASRLVFMISDSLRTIARIAETEVVKTRVLSLDEVLNDFGEVEASLLNNQRWHDPVTEKPNIGTTEIWSFVNTTDDTHPIYLRLVRFQVLDWQPFDLYDYQLTGEIHPTGPVFPPELGEDGWRDTLRAESLSGLRTTRGAMSGSAIFSNMKIMT